MMASNFIRTESDPSYYKYTMPNYVDRENAGLRAAKRNDFNFDYPDGVQDSTGEPTPPKAAVEATQYVNAEGVADSIEELVQNMIARGASTEDCIAALLQAADNMSGR